MTSSVTLLLPTGDVVRTYSTRRYNVCAQSEHDIPRLITSRDERSRGLAAWRAVCRMLPAHTDVWLIDSVTGDVVRHGKVAAS